MMANLFLKPHFHLLPLPSKLVFPYTHKPYFTTFSIAHFSTATLSYGPSLHKGINPSQSQSTQDQNDVVLREEAFTRVYDLAALRVPSVECSALESRLRGHLLNWPRIRNVARVPGDEIDPDLAPLIAQPISGDGDGEDEQERALVSLQRRIHGKAEGDGDILSPVLYRDKLAKTFNSRGFVKFRNLAKISRPARNRKKKEKEKAVGVEGDKRVRKKSFSMVEVVEEEEEAEGGGGEGFRNLLGEEFGRSKWRGSTRLLLLDERYASRSVEELPEAIKMNEILEAVLPEGIVVPSAFESVGHIAHLNLRDEHLPHKKLIAKVVLDKNKPQMQTVVNKIDSINNEYRTMQLEVLAGNHSLVTTVVENGFRFQVDLATVYWNSRLATERQRLLSGFTRNDVLLSLNENETKN